MSTRDEALELLASAAYGDDVAVTQVIRPAAILPELAARAVLSDLMLCDARQGGHWIAEPATWRRYDVPWNGTDGGPGTAQLVGTLQVVYGKPTRYEITVFRATVTRAGAVDGWTVDSLCDEAFSYGGLTLATCPRAELTAPPPPFRMR